MEKQITKIGTLFAAVTLVLLGVTLPVGAAPEEPKEVREKVRERVRMMRMWRLTEALDLDEKTGAKLFPLLNRHDEKREALHRRQRDLMEKLRVEVDSSRPDGKALGKLIDGLLEVRGKIQKLNREELKAARKVLSPVQQAKLFLFLPRFERKIHHMIEKARRGHGRRGRHGRPPGGPHGPGAPWGPGGPHGPGGPPGSDDPFAGPPGEFGPPE